MPEIDKQIHIHRVAYIVHTITSTVTIMTSTTTTKNNNSKHIPSIYYLPGIILSTSYVLITLILPQSYMDGTAVIHTLQTRKKRQMLK